MKNYFTPVAIITLSALAGSANAHGYCSKPPATFKPGQVYTNFVATTTASINKGFDGGIYNHSPVDNAKQFTEHWSATGYSSLREMIDSLVPGCGNTDESATPVDVRGYTEMWWQNNEYKQGFLDSHHGPCEGWIGETKLFHYEDCRASFPSYPAKIPTDYSSCKGKCIFTFYWIALHLPTWQIYKNCVPITNDGSGTKTPSAGGASSLPNLGSSVNPGTNNNETYGFSFVDPHTAKATSKSSPQAPQTNQGGLTTKINTPSPADTTSTAMAASAPSPHTTQGWPVPNTGASPAAPANQWANFKGGF